MSKLLAHVPRASVEERVWSFVADQRRRIPQFAVKGPCGEDVHNNVSAMRCEAQANINGSPVLQPRVPLHAERTEKRLGQENTRPDLIAEETRPVRSKASQRKLAKINVKAARIKGDDEHAARLTERRERRCATREILKDKEIMQEGSKSDGLDNKKRNESKARLKKTAALPAGLALMNSFSSKNVTKDRLTLQPSTCAAGMFSKGKASAKVKTRGIKSSSKGFDEYSFLNRTPHCAANLDESESLPADHAQAPQTSRFFKPKDMNAEQLEGIQEIDDDSSAEDSDQEDNKTVGPVSAIWSIEREFLEDETAEGQQKITPHHVHPSSTRINIKPADDVQSVCTMNTQYRLGLPMCADIAAMSYAVGSHPFAWPTESAGQHGDITPIARPASMQSVSEAGKIARSAPSTDTDLLECDEHEEDSASGHPSHDHTSLGTPSHRIHPARAPSILDEDPTSDHLLDGLDYLPGCESDAHLRRKTQQGQENAHDIDMHSSDIAIDYAAADQWLADHDDGGGLLDDEHRRACGAQTDASFEQLLPDDMRVFCHPELEQFVTAMDDQPLSAGDWMVDQDEDEDEQVEQDHVYSVAGTEEVDEMHVEEDLYGSESEEGIGSTPEVVAFTEGRSLLLGLSTRTQEKTLQFEWHPYRLG